ncbi:MFS-type transporter clz9-like [Helicoverpa zea]|uniref:MFS-type transporter clz9-like n=2 Tax=Helicoverpa zea TaxID=7113 RepID=UPI001F564D4D|nr:MFS-type transporter clz9-like [Helicoverpa zea]XP_047028044.1 MFS-type transporter clz9-like [Helicoverpa zea]XP_047032625.1 MFS-type transporter clz9-like [Helicoverpa zea]XP_047035668.1 MFS-type transporter clz9-like [Helicoverpa zea]XP_047036744.1 MFS-type transporter clz9-like [Helicoverpa zea]XP_047039035.1 MFS-type transporter clz9-like [Helicoverpa zea]XP_047039964.1 MFS-type transporter clz9-like [Helicoverpa zea]XP_047042102.1 MFS-type transporter clz9-like [Helicoverpa zea]XP_
MPRNYVRKMPKRNYKNYSQEALRDCLAAIENKELTQRKASEIYRIPRRTIINQIRLLRRNETPRPPGAPTTFTEEEEKIFVSCIQKLSEHGFPLTSFDLRIVIQSYLDKIGRRVPKFKNNCPGLEWVSSFLKRNAELSQRLAANIKRSRAGTDRETLSDYIQNLAEVLKDVPPENIWNYDETNLCDDPGQKKILTRRGTKYPEIIRDTSKSSTSIMFAGSAEGELLPPYVVYKSKQLWNTWTENGPKNTRYNCSPSGWFDMNIFNDWFFALVLPKLKKQEGPKVLIGDNLSSHISVDVLKACKENNIRFVCLPPNSTHLTQPLDVAFFHPMKVAWRKILTTWKQCEQGIREKTVQKSSFPVLLKKLLADLEENRKENLKSGFRKCGIYPTNANALLERLPKPVDKTAAENSFLETLQAKRVEWTGGVNPKRRRTKLNIVPGRSVTELIDSSLADKENEEPCLEMEAQASTSEPRRTRIHSDSTYAESEISLHDSSNDETMNDMLETMSEEETTVDNARESSKTKKFKPLIKAEGEYVAFTYEGEVFPGIITKINDKGPYISSMKRSLKYWKWPKPKDEIQYTWNEVLGCISAPKKIGRREFYTVPDLDQIWGT